MYDSFYGLTARPFQLTPDPRFWFESATHRTAMSYLGYGLAQGEGFIVITGEVGSGKTTLVGHVMRSIDPSRLTAARLVSTQIADADLLRLVANGFGISVVGPGKSHAMTAIEDFLHEEARAGRRTLLIVDEAQNLAISALEELRMLSNFQLGESPLLQIFLLGQPEFRATLASSQLEQLRQRVIATHHLEAMLPEEIEPYLIHRLSLVGWQENPVFDPSLYDALWRASGGIPRRVNAIANRLLLHGAVEEKHELDAEDVVAVVAEMVVSAPVTPVQPAQTAASVAMPDAATTPAPVPAVAEGDAGSQLAAESAARPASARVVPMPHVAPAPAAAAPAAASPAMDGEVEELRRRVAMLEDRCTTQDAAIKRVLGLLIEWVEQGEGALPSARGRAA